MTGVDGYFFGRNYFGDTGLYRTKRLLCFFGSRNSNSVASSRPGMVLLT